jgi:recombination DNA repair RAD52 pathway protein
MGEAMSHYLTDEQITLLLKPIHRQRVLSLKGMSYVEGYDIRAELNRVFGFARWSEEILEQELVAETETKTNAGKPAWNVVYRTRVRLTIHAPSGSALTFYDGSHVGESTHPVRGEAHGTALTASETYALRRAAINLGDQFGLSLYNKGSVDALVRWTLVRPEQPEKPAATTDTDDVPAISPETPEEPAEATPIQSASTKRRLAAVKEKTPKTAQELADEAAQATTPEELTALGKRGGELGHLQSEIAIPDDGSKLGLRDYLYRRLDEVSLPKSTEDPAGDPGTSAGAE